MWGNRKQLNQEMKKLVLILSLLAFLDCQSQEKKDQPKLVNTANSLLRISNEFEAFQNELILTACEYTYLKALELDSNDFYVSYNLFVLYNSLAVYYGKQIQKMNSKDIEAGLNEPLLEKMEIYFRKSEYFRKRSDELKK